MRAPVHHDQHCCICLGSLLMILLGSSPPCQKMVQQLWPSAALLVRDGPICAQAGLLKQTRFPCPSRSFLKGRMMLQALLRIKFRRFSRGLRLFNLSGSCLGPVNALGGTRGVPSTPSSPRASTWPAPLLDTTHPLLTCPHLSLAIAHLRSPTLTCNPRSTPLTIISVPRA